METEVRPRHLDRGAMKLFGDSGMMILPWTKHMLAVLWEQLRFLLHCIYYSFISVFQMFRFEVHVRISEEAGPRIQHMSSPGSSSDGFFLSSLFDNNKSMIVSGSNPLSKLGSDLTKAHTGSLLSTLVSDELCCSLVDDLVARAAEGFSDTEDLSIGSHASWKLGCPGEWNVFVGSEDSGSGSDIFYSATSEAQVFSWENDKAGEDEVLSSTYDPLGPLNFAASLFGYSSKESAEPVEVSGWNLKSSVENKPGFFCSNVGGRTDSESSWGHSDCSSADGDREESEKLWDFFSNCSDPYHPLHFTAPASTAPKPLTKEAKVVTHVGNITQHPADLPPAAVEAESTGPSSEDEEEALWQSLCHIDDPYHPLQFKACLRTFPEGPSRGSRASAVTQGPVTTATYCSPDCTSPALDVDPKAVHTLGKSRKPRLLRTKPSTQHNRTSPSADKSVFVPWRRKVKGDTKRTDADRPALKKVHFSPEVQVHKMRAWPFAFRASRKGHWEELARDRDRFHRRIQEVEQAIGYCLSEAHRERVLACRKQRRP